MKLAIIQNGDTPQIESSAQMLAAAGYETRYCGPSLRSELQRIGCDTVLSVEHMYALGYDRLDSSITAATLADMDRCDLFCEIKVRNVDKIKTRWPRLQNKVAWWRVNGAQPEICPKGGDEVNLSGPVITACMWYGTETYRMPTVLTDSGSLDQIGYQKSPAAKQLSSAHEHPQNEPARGHGPVTLGDNGMAYVMWPPYPRSHEYDLVDRKRLTNYFPPYCLCHSSKSWGYGEIQEDCVKLGVKFYGNNSPHGQIQHNRVVDVAASSLCLVHLKSVDCPGWALYEAMLSGCPVVTGRLLNSRMLADDLLEDCETCCEFGVPALLEYGRGDMNFPKCLEDIKANLLLLAEPDENRRIGENGRKRLNELMWSNKKPADVNSFTTFCKRHFR